MENPFKMATILRLSIFCIALLSSQSALAQIMIAQDDFHGLKLDEPLIVDAPGLLDNDLLDDESAAESGAVAELVADAAHGDLVLSPDGSFSYAPGPSFTGLDHFI